jgi:hypothetical protein
VVSDQVEPWRRYQGGELLEEFEGLEDDVGGAVAPGVAELVEDAAVGEQGEAFGGDGRSGDVAAEQLEAAAVASGDGDAGMDADAG